MNNNETWESTYNETYNNFAYNQTTPANTYTDTKLESYYNKTDLQSTGIGHIVYNKTTSGINVKMLAV